MQYQVQEMLRAERIFEPEAIEEELNAYNPLIPDGDNWKATMMIEYEDQDLRRRELQRLVGVDERTWCRVGEHGKIFALSDEDLDRKTEEKTAAVHFLRFELPPLVITAAKDGQAVAFGCNHENYTFESRLNDASRLALLTDLD